VEWRPIGYHQNKADAPRELKLMRIEGSHNHAFRLNWTWPVGPLKQPNLPVAEPFDPEPPDFRSLLAYVGEEFRIANVGEVPSPPWEGVLL
jgi:hypothetical protein